MINRIYEFPTRKSQNQPIDLDNIASIGGVSPVSFLGGNMVGESLCHFEIYLKNGPSFSIVYNSGTYLKCPDIIIDNLQHERQKLIEAWKLYLCPHNSE